jgi:hypothetical protein
MVIFPISGRSSGAYAFGNSVESTGEVGVTELPWQAQSAADFLTAGLVA